MMSSNFKPVGRRGTSLARSVCVAAALVAIAPAARAQGLFGFFDQSPGHIARGIEDSGYELRGPLMRRGDVYVADVVGQGLLYRVVIDARTGQVLERYPRRDLLDERPRWHDRNLVEEFDGPPRFGLDPDLSRHGRGLSDDDDDAAPPPLRRLPPAKVARGDPPPTPPAVIDGDVPAPADSLEHAKPKPRVLKHKPAPVAAIPPKTEPTAPTETPLSDSPAQAATPPQQTPSPTPKAVASPAAPEPAKTVVATPPADAPKPVAAIAPTPTPSPEPPRAEAAKPVPAKPVAEADPAPVPIPRPSPKPKAINDLPANTLD